ncbi:MAG: UvrD-helicase domain-containing protein [Deltaproteobacteria bacterium]|nr:UvrD-helicase domain-containing protein [Deltaproteobacteria bacterium]
MSLNPQQLEAVKHDHGPLLILAGAGTGKTRVLTHRIAHLIKNCGVSPGRILAVTFTNKAAGEMKRRVEGLIGPEARDLWVGTFHSICVKILRRHALSAGIAPSFTIYDAADQQSVMKQVIKDLNLDEKRFPPTQLVGRVSRLKDQLITVEILKNEASDPFQKKLAEVYEAYEKILQANNSLDFGDLISRTVLLFEKHPHLLKGYQDLLHYILVDEYQDTNRAQYRWVTLLAAKHLNLCVVGDPDQSIYRWRGADLNNILNFEKDYPHAKVIRLEQNYRSSQNILTAANAVILHNEFRKEKNLWSEKPDTAKITMVSVNSEKEEALYIVSQLRHLHETQKIPYSEMACFYRTNAQSRPLEEILRMSGIPYMIYGGLRFYERAEIKDAHAYLRVLMHPGDSVALKRIINVPTRGIGKTTIEKIEGLASGQGISFYEAAQKVDHQKLQEFMKWFFKMQEFVAANGVTPNGATPVEILQKVLETSGYLTSLTMQGSTEAQERMANLNELVASIADFSTLQNYLDHVALISDLDQSSEGGVISLMTLHLAKGLEFQAVGLVGLEEGLLPHARSMDELEELEEERRLFYVGMTRAKEYLWLSHAWRRYMNGQEQYSLPSRFLEEIPEDLMEVVENSRGYGDHRPWTMDHEEENDDFDQRSWQERRTKNEEPRTQIKPTGYRIGVKVKHPDFGVGYIAASEKTSLGEKVTVKFSNGMIKKLIAEYAHLEKV